MSDMRQVLYVVKPEDNVGTALEDIVPGAVHLRGGRDGEFQVHDAIPFGHKAAMRDIAEGEAIIKYGHQVGIATQAIQAGEYVHIHNVRSMHDTRSNTFVESDSGVAESVDREYELIN